MIPDGGLPVYIAQAEGHVRNARRYWDPSNLSSCEQCAGQLQRAVEIMTAAQETAKHGPAVPGAKERLSRMRNEVELLARLVDSAMAFSRGLALRLASEEVVHSDLKG